MSGLGNRVQIRELDPGILKAITDSGTAPAVNKREPDKSAASHVTGIGLSLPRLDPASLPPANGKILPSITSAAADRPPRPESALRRTLRSIRMFTEGSGAGRRLICRWRHEPEGA